MLHGMKKPARLRYEVLHVPDGGWVCVSGSGRHAPIIAMDKDKAKLVKRVATALSWAWGSLLVRSELVIKNKSGEISKDKRTYGLDPSRSRG